MLGLAYLRIGWLLGSTGKTADGLVASEQGAGDPGIVGCRPATRHRARAIVALAYNNIAILLLKTGRPGEALAYHEKAQGIREAMAAAKPDNVELERDLASVTTILVSYFRKRAGCAMHARFTRRQRRSANHWLPPTRPSRAFSESCRSVTNTSVRAGAVRPSRRCPSIF